MLKEGNGEKIQNESSLKVLSLSKLIKIFQAGAKLVNHAADLIHKAYLRPEEVEI